MALLPAPRPDVPHARWKGFDLYAGPPYLAIERVSSACVGMACVRP